MLSWSIAVCLLGSGVPPAPSVITVGIPQDPRPTISIDSLHQIWLRPNSGAVVDRTQLSNTVFDSVYSRLKSTVTPSAVAATAYKTYTLTNRGMSQAALVGILREHGTTEEAAQSIAPQLIRALKNPALKQVAIVMAAGGGTLAVLEWVEPTWSRLRKWSFAVGLGITALLGYRVLRRRGVMT